MTTASSTLNQIVCDNTNIDNIDFTIGGGATFAIISGLPPGVQLNNIGGNNFRISLAPSINNVTPTTFRFTVTTTGNPNGCEEASFSGTIIVNPDDGISLTSAAGTDDQTVCEGDTIALSAIDTITYTLSGGAVSANITGLPTGIDNNFDPALRQYTIFGIPTSTITTTTVFNYSITTSGTCVSETLTGKITLQPKAKLVLNTATSTLDQTVCDNTAIDVIGFDLVGSTVNISHSGLPNGVAPNPIVGNTITISGTPVVNVVTPTTYSFTVTATGDGSGCEEEVINTLNCEGNTDTPGCGWDASAGYYNCVEASYVGTEDPSGENPCDCSELE